MNDTDSPDNEHARSRNKNTEEDSEQDDVKRWRLTEDKEFRAAREEIKERLGDREVPQNKEVQPGEKKARFRAVRVGRLMCETHILIVSYSAFAACVVE